MCVWFYQSNLTSGTFSWSMVQSSWYTL